MCKKLTFTPFLLWGIDQNLNRIMAKLRIYNEIVNEEDKVFLQDWCGTDGVCYKDIPEFCYSATKKEIVRNLHPISIIKKKKKNELKTICSAGLLHANYSVVQC